MKSEIHTIYFMRPKWTTTKAREWLKNHNYIPIKRVHKMGNELRYRIRDPAQFKTFRTKKLKDDIYIVFGLK